MKKIARQGLALLTGAAAFVAAALCVAPPAWAAPPSVDVYLSSSTAGPVSGSALVVLTSESASPIYVDIYFPSTNYLPINPEFLYGPCAPSTIATYGFSMTVDGSAAVITDCQFSSVSSDYELFVQSDRTGTSACLVWNSNLINMIALGPVSPGVPEPPYALLVTPNTSGSDCSTPDSNTTVQDAQAPVAPLQQFSVPAGTTREECAEFAPVSVDWPGLELHRKLGWSVSYAQWPNGGAGGWVCSRHVYWDGRGWSS